MNSTTDTVVRLISINPAIVAFILAAGLVWMFAIITFRYHLKLKWKNGELEMRPPDDPRGKPPST